MIGSVWEWGRLDLETGFAGGESNRYVAGSARASGKGLKLRAFSARAAAGARSS